MILSTCSQVLHRLYVFPDEPGRRACDARLFVYSRLFISERSNNVTRGKGAKMVEISLSHQPLVRELQLSDTASTSLPSSKRLKGTAVVCSVQSEFRTAVISIPRTLRYLTPFLFSFSPLVFPFPPATRVARSIAHPRPGLRPISHQLVAPLDSQQHP